ncbi:HAD family hydrolase [Aliidiomarina sanyensis]|uniref:Phosphoglycolate phosphatase n=1 Tax=Aliidiomarina sanyensis TaxID=1249555 RepID=A0A432WS23_9GAMM|nr:HAD-IA family hydrolase [Aliidiomarina sanyensis]RUO36570.1 phosphoglycolate phosphatase [Aliidiomarina sanyensis]
MTTKNDPVRTAPQAILFDLDGTLLDTAPDLGFALNEVLKKYQLPIKTAEEYRPYASHGSMGLLQFGFGSSLERFDKHALRQEFLAIYETNVCVHTQLFPHVEETLARLVEKNVRLGIVTNKPTRYTDLVLAEFPALAAIDVVVCGDTLPVSKPDPAPLRFAAEQLGLAPTQCLYVGDAERDITAGRRAQMKTVLATYGYLGEDDRPELWAADYEIQCISELIEWFSDPFHS